MELTQARVRELFSYREDGSLIAIERAKGRKFGKPVGCITKTSTNAYLITMIDGKLFKVHRLVYLWHHGHMPEEVDHKDLNGLNNRIENLRPATRQNQNANKPRNRNNTSGYKGVTWDKRREKWVAQIMIDRKHIYLGQFDNAEEAHAAYVKAANENFGEFARSA